MTLLKEEALQTRIKLLEHQYLVINIPFMKTLLNFILKLI